MTTLHAVPRTELQTVTVRFAGDSGDGMQLTGSQFTSTAAFIGNDISTFPDFPAEIRAPAGTLAGVSGFMLGFSSQDIHTTGDFANVLVAMNPAALKVSLMDLEKGGIVIVNSDNFSKNDLRKAEYKENPLEDGSLENYRVVPIPISSLTIKATEDSGLSHKEAGRSKNFFALGALCWLFDRPLDYTLEWIASKFKNRPEVCKANTQALNAGFNFGLNTEVFQESYRVRPAKMPAGEYRQITGNQALSYGVVAAAKQSGRTVLYASYPITPASDVLHELARHKHFGVRILQAEDEIAAMSAAIGASFGGALGVSGTSGPGLDLKSEALGYAVMTELPVVLLNIQRGGPSTGLPTKTEQSDLLAALYGRHGECPIPIVAPCTPGDCFLMVLEAFRIAINYMTPVILLSDNSLANGAEPWRLPDLSTLPDLTPNFRTEAEGFHPYLRDPETHARPWALPGTPGLEHCLGGLEKDHDSGNINYEPENHERMVRVREAKIQAVAKTLAPLEVMGPKQNEVLVVTWGSSYGPSRSAVEKLQAQGQPVSLLVLRHLNPLPEDLGTVLANFRHIFVPEMNRGQLAHVLRAEFLVDAISFHKVQGRPFQITEIEHRIRALLRKSRPKAEAAD